MANPSENQSENFTAPPPSKNGLHGPEDKIYRLTRSPPQGQELLQAAGEAGKAGIESPGQRIASPRQGHRMNRLSFLRRLIPCGQRDRCGDPSPCFALAAVGADRRRIFLCDRRCGHVDRQCLRAGPIYGGTINRRVRGSLQKSSFMTIRRVAKGDVLVQARRSAVSAGTGSRPRLRSEIRGMISWRWQASLSQHAGPDRSGPRRTLTSTWSTSSVRSNWLPNNFTPRATFDGRAQYPGRARSKSLPLCNKQLAGLAANLNGRSRCAD